jgi:hypothetical protein
MSIGRRPDSIPIALPPIGGTGYAGFGTVDVEHGHQQLQIYRRPELWIPI